MKKFTSLLIGCSLALAGAALAQQPDEQQSPSKKKHGAAEEEHANPGQPGQPGTNAAKPEGKPAKEHGARNERGAAKGQKAEVTPKASTSTETGASAAGEPAASATPGGKHQGGRGMNGDGQGKHGKNARGANASQSATPLSTATPATAAASATPAMATASATPVATATPMASASATPATAASASVAPTVAAAGQPNGAVNGGRGARKADPQQVQQIKQQHANFRAQPKPDKVPTVTFNQSYRIQGSDRWQGPQYEVFRSYHPERHDQGYYRSHYSRVEQIGGGYYYFNSGYWYPAWGYNSSAEYYAYDGPIYVGHRSEPPDRVIADVQAELQQMGFYRGEVDGLLGPLTREALTAYQSENGLTATAAIDEPTLDALGMG